MILLDVIDSAGTFEEQMVGAVVAADYRTADIFTKYGIDYCCGGQKTIGQACTEQGIRPGVLKEEMTQTIHSGGPSEQYNYWALDFLADYIVNQHHSYAKGMLPRLSAMAKTVVEVHGEGHPELYTIGAIWQAISGEFVMHMQKEELMLFPYIRRLVRSTQEGVPIQPPTFGSAAELIHRMEEDHQSTGDQLATLAELSNGFTPPVDACNTYQLLYTYLAEFQAMTKVHVHLENNILFPKAIALEN